MKGHENKGSHLNKDTHVRTHIHVHIHTRTHMYTYIHKQKESIVQSCAASSVITYLHCLVEVDAHCFLHALGNVCPTVPLSVPLPACHDL